MIVSACQQTRLSLEGKGDYDSIEKQQKRKTMIVSACQQTHLSLEGKEDCIILENNKNG